MPQLVTANTVNLTDYLSTSSIPFVDEIFIMQTSADPSIVNVLLFGFILLIALGLITLIGAGIFYIFRSVRKLLPSSNMKQDDKLEKDT